MPAASGEAGDVRVEAARVTLTNGGASINLQLSRGSHRFEVRALNQGSVGPNTAALSITGVVKGNPRQSWSLTTGQTTGMYITVAP